MLSFCKIRARRCNGRLAYSEASRQGEYVSRAIESVATGTKMRRTPNGLLIVGDAFCGFNPIYGQGMTIAALEAIALRDCLRQGPSDPPATLFAGPPDKIRVAWQTGVLSDLGLPGVTGSRPLAMRLTHAYLERVLTAAESDEPSRNNS